MDKNHEQDLKIKELELMAKQNRIDHDSIILKIDGFSKKLDGTLEKIDSKMEKMDDKYAPIWVKQVIVWTGTVIGGFLLLFVLSQLFTK